MSTAILFISMAMQHTNDYITMCLSSPAYTVTKALTILNRFGRKKKKKICMIQLTMTYRIR